MARDLTGHRQRSGAATARLLADCHGSSERPDDRHGVARRVSIPGAGLVAQNAPDACRNRRSIGWRDMPLFPAVKFMDTVIGVDMHAVAPIPGIPIHPYVGPVYLWATPIFPSINVFINGMPACSVGALGYFCHVPQGVPVPPTPTNQPYWKRYLVNI